ncbi:hypothetical protein ACE6H2_016607 [Prunus campanulata]
MSRLWVTSPSQKQQSMVASNLASYAAIVHKQFFDAHRNGPSNGQAELTKGAGWPISP